MATNSTNWKVERRYKPIAISKKVQITKESNNKRIKLVEILILVDIND